MADFICLAMASQYTENNNTTNQETNSASFRRSLGSSALFGRRSSRSATTTAMNTPSTTRPTSESSIIAQDNQTTHIRIVPSIENPSRSLVFSIIERDLEMGRIIKIGRFTDRSSIQNHISFKSKVVSRSHCEIWLNNEGKVAYQFVCFFVLVGSMMSCYYSLLLYLERGTKNKGYCTRGEIM